MRSLLERVESGDPTTLVALTRDSLPRFHIARVGARHVERDDLHQEALAAMMELARLCAGDADRFAAEVVAHTRRRLESFLRAERRRSKAISASAIESDLWHPRTGAPTRGEGLANARLERALLTLSPRQRALLVRIYWQEASVETLAAEANVLPGAIQRARRRAEAALRRLLRGEKPLGQPRVPSDVRDRRRGKNAGVAAS